MLENKNYIVKSNHLVEARYRLSLQESHVVLWLLTQIDPKEEDFKLHKLKIKNFAEMLGLNANAQYEELKGVTKKLMQRVLEIWDPEKKEFVQVSWLSAAKYQKSKGYVFLEFSPQLKPYLLQLKTHFTKIDISEVFQFRSVYAIRIYELLSQYSPIKKRDVSIDELRKYCGIEDGEYERYSSLKEKVIDRAKNEINTKTSYNIDYKEVKKSRKVESLEWTINRNKQENKRQNEQIVNCDILDIVDFCKKHEDLPKVNYLLNVRDLEISNNVLRLTFESGFFRSQAEDILVVDRLKTFFAVDSVEMV